MYYDRRIRRCSSHSRRDIWSQPKEAIEASDRAGEFDSSLKDSTKVPGIQFADIAANLRFTARRGDSFEDALDTLPDLES